ncbi:MULTISPECIES: hypothetical protein [unclassified Nonomuraea]
MTLTNASSPGRIVAVLAFGGMVVSMMLTLSMPAYLTEPIPTEQS